MEKTPTINQLLTFTAPETVIKTNKLSFDGKHYLVRIPKDIEEILGVQKGDKFQFIVEVPPDKKMKLTTSFRIIHKDAKEKE